MSLRRVGGRLSRDGGAISLSILDAAPEIKQEVVAAKYITKDKTQRRAIMAHARRLAHTEPLQRLNQYHTRSR